MKNFWIGFLTQLDTYIIFLWGVTAGIAYTMYGINDIHTILTLLAGTVTSIRAGVELTKYKTLIKY